MNPSTILLVRHGETSLNVGGMFRGRADPDLTARGQAQAAAVARWLLRLSPAAIFSSPRQRAMQTAQAIATALGQSYEVDPGLDDLDYGPWTGLTETDVKSRWPEAHAGWRNDPASLRFEGLEPPVQMQKRVWEAFTRAWTNHSGAMVVLVTHDQPIRALICHLLSAPLKAIHSLQIDTASTTAVRHTDEGNIVMWSNETFYL